LLFASGSERVFRGISRHLRLHITGGVERASDSAPTLVASTLPFLNSISVGMPHAVLGRGFLVFVDVQLGDGQLAFVGGRCRPVPERSSCMGRTIQPSSRPAPGLGLEYVGFEAGVGDVFDQSLMDISRVVSKKRCPS
jgi:hypothetical protein